MSNDRNTITPGNDEHLVEVTTNQCCGVADSNQVKNSPLVSQAKRADESPDDLRWAELLSAAQSDRVRQEVASHESRVVKFLKRFEGSTEEVLLAMRETFVGMLRTAVVVDGERAFDSPRSRAIAHYSGQAIVYASFGKRVRSIQIAVCPHGIHWGGLTEVDRNYWEVDLTTSAESDFRRACKAAAGTVAELLFDNENFRGWQRRSRNF